MRWVKGFAALIALGVVGIAGVFAIARLSDGPIGPFPGGALESGELVPELVSDWSFAQGTETIELQLDGEDSSRTTWILTAGGAAFIPCSLSFPPGKGWHLRADRDGRAIVRIDGRRYPVQLRRLPDSAERDDLVGLIEAKYRQMPPSGGGVWFFAMESRPD